MTYTWRILDIYCDQEQNLKEVRYFLSMEKDGNSVATEGYYQFNNQFKIYPELTENQVVFALENDGADFVQRIKSRLEEQIAANIAPVRAPWLGAETFTVSL